MRMRYLLFRCSYHVLLLTTTYRGNRPKGKKYNLQSTTGNLAQKISSIVEKKTNINPLLIMHNMTPPKEIGHTTGPTLLLTNLFNPEEIPSHIPTH